MTEASDSRNIIICDHLSKCFAILHSYKIIRLTDNSVCFQCAPSHQPAVASSKSHRPRTGAGYGMLQWLDMATRGIVILEGELQCVK